jgi:hypothetical protein
MVAVLAGGVMADDYRRLSENICGRRGVAAELERRNTGQTGERGAMDPVLSTLIAGVSMLIALFALVRSSWT